MKSSILGIKGVGLLFGGFALLLASCASPPYQVVNYQAYEPTPLKPASKFWRGLAKGNSWTAKMAFYGNWGGSGNEGGKPVDDLDEGFRRHDIVYYECRSGVHLRTADRCLIEWLENLDESTLDDDQIQFRVRAVKFMNSPISLVLGKPPFCGWRRKEREDCYFSSPEIVEAFFDPNQPGFPVPPGIILTDTQAENASGISPVATAGTAALAH